MTPQRIQELATLNLPTVALQTQDCLVNSAQNAIFEEINLDDSLPRYPAHIRIVQIKKIGEQTKVYLINDKKSIGKASIRSIYEQGFNWNNWLERSQKTAEIKGDPLTGYHCIDYVIQGETYLGESWEEADQQLNKTLLD